MLFPAVRERERGSVPVSGVPGGAGGNVTAGDHHSGPALRRVGVAAAPRGLLSGGVCGLVFAKYPQLPATSGITV